MSHFYASIEGSRGMATRAGSKSSGMQGHIRGWNVGARVAVNHEDGHDVVRVYRTTGSNSYGLSELIAEFTDETVAAK